MIVCPECGDRAGVVVEGTEANTRVKCTDDARYCVVEKMIIGVEIYVHEA